MSNNEPEGKITAETEEILRENIFKLEGDLKKEINEQVDNVRCLITGLIGTKDFNYATLLQYKRDKLEKGIGQIEKIEDCFDDKQKFLLLKYRSQLLESAIYGSPEKETKEEREELSIGADLHLMIKSINNILEKI